MNIYDGYDDPDMNYQIDDEDYSFSGDEGDDFPFRNDYEIVTRNYGIDLANGIFFENP